MHQMVLNGERGRIAPSLPIWNHLSRCRVASWEIKPVKTPISKDAAWQRYKWFHMEMGAVPPSSSSLFRPIYPLPLTMWKLSNRTFLSFQTMDHPNLHKNNHFNQRWIKLENKKFKKKEILTDFISYYIWF